MTVITHGLAQHDSQHPRRTTSQSRARVGLGGRATVGAPVRTVNRQEVGVAHGVRPDQLMVPAGWPEQVAAPGTDGWERSATTWLFDCCPADYRGYPVLQRHPLVLARFAADFVDSQIGASRQALAKARVDLGGVVEVQVLDAATQVLEAENARLVRVRRGVALVEEALRGKVFLRKL